MGCAYLIYQGKDDTFARSVLLEAVRHGEDDVAVALLCGCQINLCAFDHTELVVDGEYKPVNCE